MKLKLSGDTAKTELSQVNDTNLMRRFQAGEDACFRELVLRHGNLVFAYVYRMLRGCVEAEDVARDVFVRAYRMRAGYRPSMKFRKWLMILCREHCQFLIDREKKTFGRFSRLPEGVRVSVDRLPPPGFISRTMASSHDRHSAVVKREVDALPANQRELLILSRYHSLSYSDIEEITGMPTDVVRQTLNRVKLSLVGRLAGVRE